MLGSFKIWDLVSHLLVDVSQRRRYSHASSDGECETLSMSGKQLCNSHALGRRPAISDYLQGSSHDMDLGLLSA